MKKIVGIFLSALLLFTTLTGFSACKEETKGKAKYEITAEYLPETSTLAGTLKFTYENATDEPLNDLKFQLYPNAYRKDALYKPVSSALAGTAYYKGESYGEMVVSSVVGAKAWEVTGEDENILCAELPHTLYPSEKIVLDIGFLLKLALVNHRTGITKNTVNLGNFFPILCGFKNGGFVETVYYDDGDPFYLECADFMVKLKLPKEYKLASTGKIVSEKALESKKEYTVSATKVRDFGLTLSDKYKVLRAESGDTLLSYYYYADENAEETLALVKESFGYYERTFGDYAYPEYTLAETGYCQGGMEYPAFSLISDALGGEERIRAVAHETAHQWWYAGVGSDQIENAWQDEGLAEYSAITFFEKYEKYGVSREMLVTEALKEYRSYYDVYGSVLGRTDTRMTRHLKEYLSDYEYKCIAYDKAVVTLDIFRKSVGDKKFFAGLKKYYATNLYKMATPEDFIAGFEKAGVDARGFFDGFLSGKAIL